MRRPALIFDFGNVVAHFDYRKAASRLGAKIGLSGEEVLDRVRPLGFSDLLKSYESGKISSESFSTGVSELIGHAIPHDDFIAAWADIFWANDSLAPLFGFFKRKGYTLVLGSNTNDLHASHFRRQFAETLDHFDRLVLSYEVGHVKPSSAFYLACAEAAGVEPGECVFIDDMFENVEGARAAGLVGLHYRTTDQLLVDLEGLGVEIPTGS
jgi:putative hydrolase of the HAD superfamily